MLIAFLDPLEGRLAEFPARYFPEHEVLLTEEEGRLPEGVEEAEAVVWSDYPVDAKLIERLPWLRFMQRIGWFRAAGDASAALARGIPVAVTPFGVSDRVAQHALAHTLSLVRRMRQSHEAVLRGDNPDELPEEETGRSATKINWARIADLGSLNDKAVGILGFGEIGACYARLLAPFCCRVLAYRRRPLTPEQERYCGVEYSPLDAVLAESDVVGLHPDKPHIHSPLYRDDQRPGAAPRGAQSRPARVLHDPLQRPPARALRVHPRRRGRNSTREGDKGLDPRQEDRPHRVNQPRLA